MVANPFAPDRETHWCRTWPATSPEDRAPPRPAREHRKGGRAEAGEGSRTTQFAAPSAVARRPAEGAGGDAEAEQRELVTPEPRSSTFHRQPRDAAESSGREPFYSHRRGCHQKPAEDLCWGVPLASRHAPRPCRTPPLRQQPSEKRPNHPGSRPQSRPQARRPTVRLWSFRYPEKGKWAIGGVRADGRA